ncbi:nickel-dependent lactate racemase [Ruminococcus sp. OA3]|uniref:nickel-dependent lactate racemase n=1 Tax=Ruminococcus sp. OA3 TaxID=2914164 RepID=UPI001F05AC04|nr:nickel-dependent lactate racemase [Ruminococcus sp. OA3]MCH1981678.1 nickel-dependent lactate racemase [Ruminococcus sp. OA3]
MVKINLPFGRGAMDITVPGERLNGILQSGTHAYSEQKSEEELVKEALIAPVGSQPLSELVRGKRNIVLIASDHTRPVPSRVILPPVLEEIKKGSPKAVLTILIATGFHRPTTRQELIDKFGDGIVNDPAIRFVVHQSDKEEDMVKLGTLPSGGELLINRVAADADLLMSEGFIEPHFFAGFSGGRKSVLPGVSSRRTVLANHCSEFIADANARTGILEGNPVHRDMVWAAGRAKLAFIVNVVLDANKKVIRAFAGHFEKAHQAGCAFADKLFGTDAIMSDIVVTTNGGYPLDQNIYQTVKGMTAAEASCRPGGVIIMCSSCSDGHGGQNFYDLFANEKSENVIMKRILETDRNETVPDQWEAQILCRILMNYHVIMVTQAPREMIEAMHMTYAADFEEALGLADVYLGKKNAGITVIPDGVSVIIRRHGHQNGVQ